MAQYKIIVIFNATGELISSYDRSRIDCAYHVLRNATYDTLKGLALLDTQQAHNAMKRITHHQLHNHKNAHVEIGDYGISLVKWQ